MEKIKAYLPIDLTRKASVVKRYKAIFTPIIMGVFECNEDDIEYVIPYVTASPASEYKNSQMFKFGKRMIDCIGDCDIVCMPYGWEFSNDNVAELAASIVYGKPVVVICEENDGENENIISIGLCNIPKNITLVDEQLLDDYDYFYVCDATLPDGSTVELYVTYDFGLVDVGQYYTSGIMEPLESDEGGDNHAETEHQGNED